MASRREPNPSLLIGMLIAGLVASVVIKRDGRGLARGENKQLGTLSVGAPLPTANLTDLAGAPITLSPAHGNPMLLEVGATWCGPCRALLGPLRAVHRELADLPLDVISIDVQEPAEVVKAHYATRDLGGVRVALDLTGQVAREWGIEALPTLVLVDGRGIVRLIRVGAWFDRDDLGKRIRKEVAP